MWHQNNAIHGAAQTLNLFQSLGKRVFYVTNNSTKTREEFVIKCHGLAFEAKSDNILCTSYLVGKYLQDIQFKKKVYLVGSSGKQFLMISVEKKTLPICLVFYLLVKLLFNSYMLQRLELFNDKSAFIHIV